MLLLFGTQMHVFKSAGVQYGTGGGGAQAVGKWLTQGRQGTWLRTAQATESAWIVNCFVGTALVLRCTP